MMDTKAWPDALIDDFCSVAGTWNDAPPPGLMLADELALASKHGLSRRQVQLAALSREIVPERYRRNLGTVGWDGQRQLLESAVAVIGAGGLGGWVCEVLARMGVGTLRVVDGDTFQENNLNRQLTCTVDTLGASKAQAMAARLALVNEAVSVDARHDWLTANNAAELLAGVDVVVDALDTLPARMLLQDAARAANLPLVHGAIGGYGGQVMTILPGDAGLRALYGDGPWPERGVEVKLGNPSATPMMISAWQAHEVVKLITSTGELLRARMLMLDALYGTSTVVELG